MIHVVVTIRREGEEDSPFVRSKNYAGEDDIVKDIPDIIETIKKHVR